MTALLTSNKDAKRGLKLVMTLALLPADKIEAGVAHIANFLQQKNLQDDFQTFLAYVFMLNYLNL